MRKKIKNMAKANYGGVASAAKNKLAGVRGKTAKQVTKGMKSAPKTRSKATERAKMLMSKRNRGR